MELERLSPETVTAINMNVVHLQNAYNNHKNENDDLGVRAMGIKQAGNTMLRGANKIKWIAGILKDMGKINDQTFKAVMGAAGAMQLAMGLYEIYQSVHQAVSMDLVRQTTAAAVETGVAVVAQNYVGIAIAASAAVIVAAAFGVGYMAGQASVEQNIRVKADWKNAEGRRRVSQTMKENQAW